MSFSLPDLLITVEHPRDPEQHISPEFVLFSVALGVSTPLDWMLVHHRKISHIR
jgi:hypothetical protein